VAVALLLRRFHFTIRSHSSLVACYQVPALLARYIS
jgi:hypothetical protein